MMEKKTTVDKLIDALRAEAEAKCAAIRQRDEKVAENSELSKKIADLESLNFQLRNTIANNDRLYKDKMRSCVRISWCQSIDLRNPYFFAVPNDDHSKCVSSPTLAGVVRKLVNKHPDVAEEMKRWTR